MGVYTDATKVRKIVDLDVDLDVDPFIDAAEEIVAEVCATAKKADGVTPYHSDHRLTVISTWLAAHFVCILDPRAQRERVAVLTFEAQSKVGLALDVTHYGQQAKVLDSSGGLAKLDAQAKMNPDKVPIRILGKVVWLGMTPEEYTASLTA